MNATRTVLIVDDNPLVSDVIEDFLKAHDFNVLCARDGTAALSLMDAHRIDLAVVDLLLPGPLSGDDVAAHAVDRNVKVIIISGALASDTRGRDLRHPHLLKPFRMAVLLKTIESTFAA